MQQLTLPGEIVKKHNDLVRSKINISGKTSSRILACLLAAIQHEDTQFKETYSIPIKNYLPPDEDAVKGGSQYKLVKEACRELIKGSIEKEWPDPDNPNGDPIFQIMPLFTSIKYRNGIVQANFNPRLSDLLLHLRSFFTQYNLIEYLSLPSFYSQRLFEILKSWSNIPSGEVILSVAELHRLLNTPPSFQADFRQFRTRVIEKAHKDIHEKTPLRFEWEPVKAGRTVEAVRFTFGPGRRAIIAEAEKKKAREEKQRRLVRTRWHRAYECAKAKNGLCTTQDNKRIICKTCMAVNFCEDLRKQASSSQPTDV